MQRQLQSPRRKTTMILALPKRPRSVGTDGASLTMPVERRPASRLRKLGWFVLLLALVGTGTLFRLKTGSVAAEPSSLEEAPLRQVTVAAPQRTSSTDVNLPGTIQAYQATDLYARANGFLKTWNVDIGATVKSGQVLAEIQTPELDQELAQSLAQLGQGRAEHQQAIAELEEAHADVALAEANVVKAKANVDFAVSQANRYEYLLRSKAASRQEYESVIRERDAHDAELSSTKAELKRRKTNLVTRQSIIDSRAAVVKNREANVQRLRDLTGFQKVVAPFDGIVTRRNAEVGMLVTAGSNVGTRPLYSIAQIDTLRVHVAVPQSSALDIKTGDEVRVTIPEKPGTPYLARVTRTAGAVEPTSRSLLVEVELPNRDGRLLPGVYAQLRFRTTKERASWLIPAKTILMRSTGPHVVLVAADGSLRAQKVTLGRDFGASAEVLVGLEGSERLVVNPSDDLRDGQAVRVASSSNLSGKAGEAVP